MNAWSLSLAFLPDERSDYSVGRFLDFQVGRNFDWLAAQPLVRLQLRLVLRTRIHHLLTVLRDRVKQFAELCDDGAGVVLCLALLLLTHLLLDAFHDVLHVEAHADRVRHVVRVLDAHAQEALHARKLGFVCLCDVGQLG